MHRFDGAEQYFTRAVDFGFSFSIEETFEKWGREEILADFVRLIRTFRPDVMLTLRPDGEGWRTAHQASAVLARDAFKLAADPTKYPEQRKTGLRPGSPGAVLPAQDSAAARCAAPASAAAARQPRRLRCAARPNLLRDRHRGAQHAQVSGHGAAALAAGAVETTLQLVERPAGRIDAARYGICTTASTIRLPAWRSSPERGLRASSPMGLTAIAATVLDAQKRFDAAAARRCAAAAARRSARHARAARAIADDAGGRTTASTRSSSGCARRSASSSRQSFSPTAFASTRWRTTASSFPGSRSASPSCSPITARRRSTSARSASRGSTATPPAR